MDQPLVHPGALVWRYNSCEVAWQPQDTPFQRGAFGMLCALITAVEGEGVLPGVAYTVVQEWMEAMRSLSVTEIAAIWARMEDA